MSDELKEEFEQPNQGGGAITAGQKVGKRELRDDGERALQVLNSPDDLRLSRFNQWAEQKGVPGNSYHNYRRVLISDNMRGATSICRDHFGDRNDLFAARSFGHLYLSEAVAAFDPEIHGDVFHEFAMPGVERDLRSAGRRAGVARVLFAKLNRGDPKRLGVTRREAILGVWARDDYSDRLRRDRDLPCPDGRRDDRFCAWASACGVTEDHRVTQLEQVLVVLARQVLDYFQRMNTRFAEDSEIGFRILKVGMRSLTDKALAFDPQTPDPGLSIVDHIGEGYMVAMEEELARIQDERRAQQTFAQQ